MVYNCYKNRFHEAVSPCQPHLGPSGTSWPRLTSKLLPMGFPFCVNLLPTGPFTALRSHLRGLKPGSYRSQTRMCRPPACFGPTPACFGPKCRPAWCQCAGLLRATCRPASCQCAGLLRASCRPASCRLPACFAGLLRRSASGLSGLLR